MFASSLALCTGCGATGLAWVGEGCAESAQMRVDAANSVSSRGAPPATIPATAEPDAPDSRPRLSRTVTLGEIDQVAERADAGPTNVASGSVNIYNYNQVNLVTPAFGYGTFGYARFSPVHVTPEPARSGVSGPLPGQNWPAVADHGPSFPYASAPASPWTRTQ
ncbi:MAG TPA: hypothetical protein VGJ91_17045 [Polyangiaceae bacterium]